MKVYILMGGYEYSSCHVENVFNNLEDAMAEGSAKFAATFEKALSEDEWYRGIAKNGETPEDYDFVWIEVHNVIGT